MKFWRRVLANPQKGDNKTFFMNTNPNFSQYKIGRFTYGKPSVLHWGEEATLEIGSFCSIADDVTIMLGGNHRIDWISTYPFNFILNEYNYIKGHPSTNGNVTIGNDVWIGWGSFILSGINIGDGAVIGARSVVTKDVEPYTIVAGNPARLIRKRFAENTIQKLLRIKWWDWELDQIRKHVPLLLSEDVSGFIENMENYPK